jgi:putative salt-induced outer membrane protein
MCRPPFSSVPVIATVAMSLLFPWPLHAQETKQGWSGRVQASYARTSGGTRTQTLSGRADLRHESSENRRYLTGTGLLGRAGGRETANRWSIVARHESDMTDRFFVYAATSFLEDRFSGYTYRFTIGPGVGYYLLKSLEHQLKIRAGLDYSLNQVEPPDEHSDSYLSGRLAGEYQWQIRPNLRFRQTATYLPSLRDKDVYFLNSDSSLEVRISALLSLSVSLVLNYKNETPNGATHLDSTSLTSLVLTF